MLIDFVKELEDELQRTPLESIDIRPILERHIVGESYDEIARSRLDLQAKLDEMVSQGWLNVERHFHGKISMQIGGKYSTDPIKASGTIRLVKEYEKRNSPGTIHNDNSVKIDVSHSRLRDLNLHQNSPNTAPAQNSSTENQNSLLEKTLMYIGDNVVKIIVGVIIAAICVWIKLKK